MEININLVLLVLLLILMFLKPIPLKNIYNSLIGRLFILGMVVYFTVNHTVLGLLAVIILITSIQADAENDKHEGFENKVIAKTFQITGNDRITVENKLRSKNQCNLVFKTKVNKDPEPMPSEKDI